MAGGLKTKGIQELSALRRRAHRQYALGRVSRRDRDKLVKMLDEVEAFIVSELYEKNNKYEGEIW